MSEVANWYSPALPILLILACSSLMRVAAERDVPIRPATLQHVERAGAGRELSFRWQLGEAWPRWARQDFEAVVESGQNQVGVWGTSRYRGALHIACPGVGRGSQPPQRSIIHRHTVDRHQIEALSLLPGVHSLGMSMNELRPRRRTALLLATLFR